MLDLFLLIVIEQVIRLCVSVQPNSKQGRTFKNAWSDSLAYWRTDIKKIGKRAVGIEMHCSFSSTFTDPWLTKVKQLCTASNGGNALPFRAEERTDSEVMHEKSMHTGTRVKISMLLHSI